MACCCKVRNVATPPPVGGHIHIQIRTRRRCRLGVRPDLAWPGFGIGLAPAAVQENHRCWSGYPLPLFAPCPRAGECSHTPPQRYHQSEQIRPQTLPSTWISSIPLRVFAPVPPALFTVTAVVPPVSPRQITPHRLPSHRHSVPYSLLLTVITVVLHHQHIASFLLS